VPFSLAVTSLDGRPIVTERTTSTGAPARRSGTAVIPGSPVAASKWLVAQGGPSETRSTTVSVSNPGAATVRIRVVQLTAGTRRRLPGGTFELGPYDRRNIPLADAAKAATLEIAADGPIVVSYGLSANEGPGLALALGEPFPESVLALPPPPEP
jgi:hypothetical protein